MSRDRFDVLQRYERLVAAPAPSFELFLRRRDRKRRRQRVTAGAVGIAVFVAVVVLIATGGGVEPSTTLGGSGLPGSTGPAISPPDDRVGLVGLPPEGATPSLPEVGQVVLRASARHLVCGSDDGMFCFVWLYADGRLIWIADAPLPYGANEHTTGLLEQRLTPAGIELLVSEFTSAGGCSAPSDSRWPIVCSGLALESFPAISKPVGPDPTWGLPASAWEDPEVSPFVSSRFGACFLHAVPSPELYLDLTKARVLDWIPSSAADLLRGKEVEVPTAWDGDMRCFAVTTEEARDLSKRLDEAGVERDEGYQPYGLSYQLVGTNRFPEPGLLILPILPDGEWVLSGFS
jgi:hypothetical protein